MYSISRLKVDRTANIKLPVWECGLVDACLLTVLCHGALVLISAVAFLLILGAVSRQCGGLLQEFSVMRADDLPNVFGTAIGNFDSISVQYAA